MSLFHNCTKTAANDALDFGCTYSGNGGVGDAYKRHLFGHDRDTCDVCGIKTGDPLLNICAHVRRTPSERHICSTCCIAVMQTEYTGEHDDQRIWQVQNSRTVLVTSLMCIKILNDMRRYIHYNKHTDFKCPEPYDVRKWTYEVKAEKGIDQTRVDIYLKILYEDEIVYSIIGM